jgi:hypothetical protein
LQAAAQPSEQAIALERQSDLRQDASYQNPSYAPFTGEGVSTQHTNFWYGVGTHHNGNANVAWVSGTLKA